MRSSGCAPGRVLIPMALPPIPGSTALSPSFLRRPGRSGNRCFLEAEVPLPRRSLIVSALMASLPPWSSSILASFSAVLTPSLVARPLRCRPCAPRSCIRRVRGAICRPSRSPSLDPSLSNFLISMAVPRSPGAFARSAAVGQLSSFLRHLTTG
jgi:hypothetical protein